jgi:cytochrome c2
MTNLSDASPCHKGTSYKNYILGLSLVLTILFAQHVYAAKPTAAKAAPATASATAPAASTSATAGDAAAGEKLFTANCTSCHKINSQLIGPALRDVDKKESDEWLHKWIKNNGALRASGDKDALAIYTQFNKTEMTQFTSFSDADISNIIAYIKQESAKPVGGPSATPGQPGGETGSDPYVGILLWLLVIILGAAALILNRNINALGKMVREKSGEPIVERIPIYKNKTFIALASILVVIFVGYTTVDNAVRAGHEQNYQPDQPIKFPHSVHAGINGINCLYCHAGAEKGRTAMIPSPNICMNCHKAISSGTNTGTTEIAKIYYAVGWDPAKGQYTGVTHPIHWVKIHNLPAHVYFNHSQHVVVGKLACQTCHGQIQDMEQVYQYATLSMGWCINCHRTTPVQFATNKYYTSMFPKLDEELKSGKIKQVTVADLGGTECQRCHY